MTHEWQVGTQAVTDVFEMNGIDVGELVLKQGMHPNLHDIEYDIFKALQESDKYPGVAIQYGIPDFRSRLGVLAGEARYLGVNTPDLQVRIAQFHLEAGTILQRLVSDHGVEFIYQFYH